MPRFNIRQLVLEAARLHRRLAHALIAAEIDGHRGCRSRLTYLVDKANQRYNRRQAKAIAEAKWT
jgi:hypothetical protein